MPSRLTLRSASYRFTALSLAFGVLLYTPLVLAATATVTAPAQPAAASTVVATTTVSTSELQPSELQSKLSRDISRQLATLNYNRIVLNDALSAVIYNRYLSDLDGQHLYFLAADIDGFERWKSVLDQQIKNGQLAPAFTIFNRAQQRMRERLEFVLSELDKDSTLLDFTGTESLQNDRKDSPWAKSRTELDQLWRLRLKGSALSMKLSGKKNEEILTTLKRRYKSQLTALAQTKSEDAFQAFMNAYAESYDPHTEYFSPRSSENFNINMSLQLEGIGAVLQTEDEYTKIVRLVPAGPADKSRQLKTGDRIVGVAEGDKDFVDVIGWRIDEVVQLIRGAKGTVVRLQILPAGGTDAAVAKVISLTRNTVALEDQAASKRIITIKRNGTSHAIGVIKLPTFYADFQGMQNGNPNYRSTTRDVHKLLVELKAAHVQGIILDLRNNGGGSLSEVNDLIGEFISTGPTVQVRDARGKIEVLGDGNPSITYSGPLTVVTNRLSASAAEIFAGAIQDYGRGLIVGGTTFGKGTVQSLREMGSGQLKLTEAKFYRISGASTQNKGVEPDIHFPELFDSKEVGESALPQAMAWDTIAPARYQRLNDWSLRTPLLEKASKARQAANPDFRYLFDQQALLAQLKEQKTTTLNEVARGKEKASLDAKRLLIENRRRLAKGMPALKTAEALDDQQEKSNPSQNPNFERPEEMALLNEAGEILIDTQPKVAVVKKPTAAPINSTRPAARTQPVPAG